MTYQIYVINMSSSSDRFKSISDQLEEQNLRFKRIPGINVLEEEQLKNKHYSKKKNKFNYFVPLTDGEIGCYIAHRNAWEEILADETDFGLVLEDDAFLKDNLKSILDNLDIIKTKWDILKLADLSMSPRKGANIEKFQKYNLQRYLKPPTLSVAEVITKEGAKKLLNLSSTFGRPADVDIQWFKFEGLKISGLRPYPVDTNDKFESIIDSFGNRRSLISFREKLNRKLKRIWLNVIYKIKLLEIF